MAEQITTAAVRRIARRHKQHAPAHGGGVLAFNEDVTGGTWYAAGTRPGRPIVFPVGHGRVTAREVQDWLDHREEFIHMLGTGKRMVSRNDHASRR